MRNPKNTPANATGQAELCTALSNASGQLINASIRMRQLETLIGASRFMSDALRLLDALDAHAKLRPEFGVQLKRVDAQWSTLAADGEAVTTLGHLLGLAQFQAAEAASEAEKAASRGYAALGQEKGAA